MAPPPSNLFSNPYGAKEVLRLKLEAERNAATEKRPEAARHAARIFLKHIPVSASDIVSLYMPIKTELDTGPLADALFDKGVVIVLPVTVKKRGPLVFRAYAKDDPLIKGGFGVMVPAETAPALSPTIIVTPLLGFSRNGDRVGYGGGYYDRTLKALRAAGEVTAVGYAFGAQEVDALPAIPLDQRLDWIVTERDAVKV